MTALAHPLAPPVPRLPAPLTAVASLLVRRGLGDLLDGVTTHDDRALLRVLLRGEMGAGEGDVAGEWDADDLVGLIRASCAPPRRAASSRG